MPEEERMPEEEWASIRRRFIHNTALLWYSLPMKGLRGLLVERGYDPQMCLLKNLNQGDDECVGLFLPDWTYVTADYYIDPETGQAFRFSRWEQRECDDSWRYARVAKALIHSESERLAFVSDVRAYWEANLQADDRPPQTGTWGDCGWHYWRRPEMIPGLLNKGKPIPGRENN